MATKAQNPQGHSVDQSNMNEILLYWSGELTSDQQDAVEERLADDPEAFGYLRELQELSTLAEELPGMDVLRESPSRLAVTPLLSNQKFTQKSHSFPIAESESKSPRRRQRTLRLGSLIALSSIAALLAIGLVLTSSEPQESPNEVARYTPPMPKASDIMLNNTLGTSSREFRTRRYELSRLRGSTFERIR